MEGTATHTKSQWEVRVVEREKGKNGWGAKWYRVGSNPVGKNQSDDLWNHFRENRAVCIQEQSPQA